MDPPSSYPVSPDLPASYLAIKLRPHLTRRAFGLVTLTPNQGLHARHMPGDRALLIVQGGDP